MNVNRSSDFGPIVSATARDAEHLYREFFTKLDRSRQDLNQFVGPNTAIVWNGNPIGGSDAFIQMATAMPVTDHEVLDYNVNPLSQLGDVVNMIVNATGKVKFGNERGKNLFGFNANFVVRKVSTQMQIMSMSYRLTHKPEDSTLVM